MFFGVREVLVFEDAVIIEIESESVGDGGTEFFQKVKSECGARVFDLVEDTEVWVEPDC